MHILAEEHAILLFSGPLNLPPLKISAKPSIGSTLVSSSCPVDPIRAFGWTVCSPYKAELSRGSKISATRSSRSPGDLCNGKWGGRSGIPTTGSRGRRFSKSTNAVGSNSTTSALLLRLSLLSTCRRFCVAWFFPNAFTRYHQSGCLIVVSWFVCISMILEVWENWCGLDFFSFQKCCVHDVNRNPNGSYWKVCHWWLASRATCGSLREGIVNLENLVLFFMMIELSLKLRVVEYHRSLVRWFENINREWSQSEYLLYISDQAQCPILIGKLCKKKQTTYNWKSEKLNKLYSCNNKIGNRLKYKTNAPSSQCFEKNRHRACLLEEEILKQRAVL